MRLMAVVAACVSIMTASTGVAKQSTDEDAVRAVLDSFVSSWNTPGQPDLEELFTPDADFVVITGQWLKGRDEIVSYTRDLLKTVYKGSSLTSEKVVVRFLRKDMAVAHFASNVHYARDGKQAVRMTLMTVVLTKQARWQIAAAENVQTGGDGYPFRLPH